MNDKISVLIRLIRIFIEEWKNEDLQIMNEFKFKMIFLRTQSFLFWMNNAKIVFIKSFIIYVRNRSYTNLINDFVVNDLLKYMKKNQKYYVNNVNYKIFLIIECSFRKKLFKLTLQVKKCRIIKEFLKNHFHYINKRDREFIIAVKHRRRKIKIKKSFELFIK